MFDGSTPSGTATGGSVSANGALPIGCEFNPPLTGVTDIQFAMDSNAGSLVYTDENDVEYTYSWTPNVNYDWSNNAPTPPSTLKKFSRKNDSNGAARIIALQVNGDQLIDGTGEKVSVVSTDLDNNTMVVDGGEWIGSDGSITDGAELSWNQDQVWSDDVTAGSVVFVESAGPKFAFNGLTTIASDQRFVIVSSNPFNVNEETVITLKGLEAGEVVQFLGKQVPNSQSITKGTVRFNGFEVTDIFESGIIEAEWNVLGTSLAGDNVITVSVGNGNTDIYAIKVGSRLLVDQGIDGAPTGSDSHVEYQTNGGEGTIVSVNTDDNTILLSDTGDRDNRWIAENKAGTDFYVAGPSKVDEPLLTADVLLESTPLTTEPEDGLVIDKKYVWKLNGAIQETDQNPFRPTLSLNTEYTVSCVHKDGQGNLEDSEESSSITFTTGASRNVFEYQQNIITELRSRLSSIEADEINDDATDTLLISTIADLINRVNALEGN